MDKISLKAYRLDFMELLLCMAVSHLVIGVPFFGAAIFLFADIIKASLFCNILKFSKKESSRILSFFFVAVVLFIGLTLVVLYPSHIGKPQAYSIALFVLCIVLRDAISAFPTSRGRSKKVLYWLFIAYTQVRLDLFCAIILFKKVDREIFWALIAITVLTGIFRLLFPEKLLRFKTPSDQEDTGIPDSLVNDISSYRIFSNMTLYSTIALSIGVMMFFCLMLVRGSAAFQARTYLNMLAWLFGIGTAATVFGSLIKKQWIALGLAEFIFGATIWIFGAIFMFRARTTLGVIAWMAAWGIGIALIDSAIRQFHRDFEAVGQIHDEVFSAARVEISNTLVSTVSSIIASVTMLLVMALWTFLAPEIDTVENLPRILQISMMQIPVIYMLAAIVFALRQPLDARNREKLMLYIERHSKDERIRESLNNLLVKKYMMRFGVKVICTLARPFLHLKVSGMENLRKNEYPSIFVCNHGFIYGPVAAVIYLPTYFRPWIHDVMLDRKLCAKEISYSFKGFLKLTGQRTGGTIIRWATRPVCWALNSFNPIPVARGSSHDVMSTFNLSVDALKDGDNILIFPERPSKRTKSGGEHAASGSDELRNFYTGFAHIGKMYHDETGKTLAFYPLYSDSEKHLFKIGEPVLYDPTLSPRDSRKQIAATLHERMQGLSG